MHRPYIETTYGTNDAVTARKICTLVLIWHGYFNSKPYRDVIDRKKSLNAYKVKFANTADFERLTGYGNRSEEEIFQKYAKKTRKKNKIADKTKGLCLFCGLTPIQPTIEHLLPRKIGGGNSTHNVFIACSKCNAEAGSMTIPEKIEFAIQKRVKITLKNVGGIP